MNVRRESDIEVVRKVAQLALNENERLVAEMVRLRREILVLKGATPQQLQQELALLEQRFADDAARLEAEVAKHSAEAKEQQAKVKPARKPRERSGTRLEQKTLPVVEVVHDVDEADASVASAAAIRHCGKAMTT